MVSPLSNITPRLRAQWQKKYITLTDSKNIRKIRRFGRVKEQSFRLVFIQLKLVVDGPLLYIAHTVFHVAEKKIRAGTRS